MCPAPEALSELVRREGSEASRSRTAEHLRECAECRSDLNVLRSASAPRPRESSWRDQLAEPRTLMIGGGIVALAAIIGFAIHAISGSKSASRSHETQPVPVANASGSRQPVRSSAAPELLPPVLLIEPELGARVTKPVALTWHAIPNAMRYRVEVLDAGNWPAFAITTEDTAITIPAKSRLRARHPYRWWVQATLIDGTHQRSAPRAIRIVK